MNKFQIFISFAVLSFTVLPAQSSTEIKIGLTGFKPYSDYNQETGECVGVAIDFTQELLQPYGLEVSATCASPARIYRSISRGLVDISLNIKSTTALSDSVTFTKIPFDDIILNLYTYTKGDTSQKQIAAIRGYDYNGYREKLIKMGFEFIDVSKDEDAIRMFASKRTNYLLSYSGPFDDYVKNISTLAGSFEPGSYKVERLTAIPTHYAISKASPHYDVLLRAFTELESNRELDYYFTSAESQ